MSESADAQRSSTTPDIRVGDLVKATHIAFADLELKGTVREVTTAGAKVGPLYPGFLSWTFEVLDRPLPPIEEELLAGVKSAYQAVASASPNGRAYTDGMKAVINFVREYDQKNATKENA